MRERINFLGNKLVNITNSYLARFGFVITKSRNATTMHEAIKRIVGHKIKLNTVIDVGASDGKWCVDVMSIFNKKNIQYLAIDPLWEREDALKKIRGKNKNFDYVLCIAGEKNGSKCTISVTDDLDGSTVGGGKGEKRDVIIRSIDSIVDEKKLKGPFLIKFDTHGFEIPIMNGAENTLKETSLVIMEVYNFKTGDFGKLFYNMCEYMEKYGFRCYDMADPMLRKYDKVFWQVDLFFIKNDNKMFSYSYYA